MEAGHGPRSRTTSNDTPTSRRLATTVALSFAFLVLLTPIRSKASCCGCVSEGCPQFGQCFTTSPCVSHCPSCGTLTTAGGAPCPVGLPCTSIDGVPIPTETPTSTPTSTPTTAPAPIVAPWGLLVMALSLVSAGVWAILRRT